MLDGSMKPDLDALRRDELSVDSRNNLAKKLLEEATSIAQAIQRRFGSPDGVTGPSDLANSRVAAIMTSPNRELGRIDTVSDLERALYRMLADSWISRRRKAAATKRGGRISRVTHDASDVASIVDLIAAPPTYAEVQQEVEDILAIFPLGSKERLIIEALLDGETQEEVGRSIGISRDSVGRRIRNVIAPIIHQHFLEPEGLQ